MMLVMMKHRVMMSTEEDEEEESRRCYERYRILVQNECAGGELAALFVSGVLNSEASFSRAALMLFCKRIHSVIVIRCLKT